MPPVIREWRAQALPLLIPMDRTHLPLKVHKASPIRHINKIDVADGGSWGGVLGDRLRGTRAQLTLHWYASVNFGEQLEQGAQPSMARIMMLPLAC